MYCTKCGKEVKERIIAIVLVLTIVLCFSACGSGIEGEYTGTAGTYLKLNNDGTCLYAEDDDTGATRGEWYIENNILYIKLNAFEDKLYANLNDDKEGFILESRYLYWRDEYFSKVD